MDSPTAAGARGTLAPAAVTRERLLHALYEAAELEHCLMCTYVYAAVSLRDGPGEGLGEAESDAVRRWRGALTRVAVDEMGHLVAVWNITAALGGSPRFGRGNFPLDAGLLPAGVVVRLAPFGREVLQHFIFLERPHGSSEPDGRGFETEWAFSRDQPLGRITPMPIDYETVGAFYADVGAWLREFVERLGEASAFCGDPLLQLSAAELTLAGAEPVICSKTALARFQTIVAQGEGAPGDARGSHYETFCAIRAEYDRLEAANPNFAPAFGAAVNPVLRRPVRPGARVWIEDAAAAAAADVANSAYGLMLRLLAYAYLVRRPAPEKSLAIDLALGLMRAFTLLAEQVARLPAGPSHPHCNAGVSFVTLRDTAPLPPGAAARRFFRERFDELAQCAAALDAQQSARLARAAQSLAALARQARRGFDAADAAASDPAAQAPARPATAAAAVAPGASPAPEPPLPAAPAPGVEVVQGKDVTILYEGAKCIHARFCVTGAPKVFLANVAGPWIHPDAMDVEALVAIAHACPSGAIGYRRSDGRPDEAPPPVNLLALREAGPYAVRAPMVIDGVAGPLRATLCRCGASQRKPFCDGSHHGAGFTATGEPATVSTEMLAQRDGPLAIDPEPDGPLQLRGNLEIVSGTGRVVARLTQARLCRCGASANKPFCDGSHARVGFRSAR